MKRPLLTVSQAVARAEMLRGITPKATLAKFSERLVQDLRAKHAVQPVPPKRAPAAEVELMLQPTISSMVANPIPYVPILKGRRH